MMSWRLLFRSKWFVFIRYQRTLFSSVFDFACAASCFLLPAQKNCLVTGDGFRLKTFHNVFPRRKVCGGKKVSFFCKQLLAEKNKSVNPKCKNSTVVSSALLLNSNTDRLTLLSTYSASHFTDILPSHVPRPRGVLVQCQRNQKYDKCLSFTETPSAVWHTTSQPIEGTRQWCRTWDYFWLMTARTFSLRKNVLSQTKQTKSALHRSCNWARDSKKSCAFVHSRGLMSKCNLTSGKGSKSERATPPRSKLTWFFFTPASVLQFLLSRFTRWFKNRGVTRLVSVKMPARWSPLFFSQSSFFSEKTAPPVFFKSPQARGFPAKCRWWHTSLRHKNQKKKKTPAKQPRLPLTNPFFFLLNSPLIIVSPVARLSSAACLADASATGGLKSVDLQCGAHYPQNTNYTGTLLHLSVVWLRPCIETLDRLAA